MLKYIADVQFHSPLTGITVQFDSRGDVEGRHEIWNYQAKNANGTSIYGFSKAGVWDNSLISETRSSINGSVITALNFTDMHEYTSVWY